MSTGTQIEVVMPQMGVSVSEGTITKWLKQPGEAVARDEPLLEISTDKVDTEVPSPGEGVLAEILVPEGSDGRGRHRARPDRARRQRSEPGSAAEAPAPEARRPPSSRSVPTRSRSSRAASRAPAPAGTGRTSARRSRCPPAAGRRP